MDHKMFKKSVASRVSYQFFTQSIRLWTMSFYCCCCCFLVSSSLPSIEHGTIKNFIWIGWHHYIGCRTFSRKDLFSPQKFRWIEKSHIFSPSELFFFLTWANPSHLRQPTISSTTNSYSKTVLSQSQCGTKHEWFVPRETFFFVFLSMEITSLLLNLFSTDSLIFVVILCCWNKFDFDGWNLK